MAANVQPIFPASPQVGQASITTGLTTRANITGTSGLTQLVASATNGQRIDRIRVMSNSAISTPNSANIVRVWIYDGTTARLFDEIVTTAVTPSATVAGFVSDTSYSSFVIPANYSVYVSCHTTDAYNVIGFGGTY